MLLLALFIYFCCRDAPSKQQSYYSTNNESWVERGEANQRQVSCRTNSQKSVVIRQHQQTSNNKNGRKYQENVPKDNSKVHTSKQRESNESEGSLRTPSQTEYEKRETRVLTPKVSQSCNYNLNEHNNQLVNDNNNHSHVLGISHGNGDGISISIRERNVESVETFLKEETSLFENIVNDMKTKSENEFYQLRKDLINLHKRVTSKSISSDVYQNSKQELLRSINKEIQNHDEIINKLKTLKEIAEHSENFIVQIKNYEGEERAFLHLREMLLRQMEKVDLIKANNISCVKEAKLKILNRIEVKMNILENKYAEHILNSMDTILNSFRRKINNYWGDETNYMLYSKKVNELTKKISDLSIHQKEIRDDRCERLKDISQIKDDLNYIKDTLYEINKLKENLRNSKNFQNTDNEFNTFEEYLNDRLQWLNYLDCKYNAEIEKEVANNTQIINRLLRQFT